MEFGDLVRQRRMTRHFRSDPVDDAVLARVFDAARRVPSAGNAQGFDFVALRGPDETARYWDVTLPPERRGAFKWASLLKCPVLVTVWADPGAYVARYAESDKSATGLGTSPDAWTTPYWTVDASFAAMALQYAALDEGLGVLFFGMFSHAEAIATELGVPAGHEPIGVVAVGWPDERLDTAQQQGASSQRPRRPLFDAGSDSWSASHTSSANEGGSLRPFVHWGRWLRSVQ